MGESTETMAQLPSFEFVFIPVDLDRPLEQWQQEQPIGQEVECLTTRLQQFYRETTSSNAASKETLKKQLQGQVPEGTVVTDEMLAVVSGMQLVESAPLMNGTKVNGFTHVNMYCDDSGTAKGLPTNQRASAISDQCGLPRNVCGDAFISRMVDDGNDLFERLSFSLDELSSDAQWLQQAKAKNLGKTADDQISKMQDLVPGAKLITPGANQSGASAMEMDEEMPAELGSCVWSQSDDEIEVRVLCPNCTKSKDVSCTVRSNSVHLVIKTLENGEVLNGKLHSMVDSDDTNWSIEDCGEERVVRLTMAKANAGSPWPSYMLD